MQMGIVPRKTIREAGAMTQLTKLDARILDARLLDARLGGTGSVGGFAARPRYNTQIMTRFIDTSDPNTKPLAADLRQKPPVCYSQHWDADLQSYMYLQEFVRCEPQWVEKFAKIAVDANSPLGMAIPSQFMK